MAKPAAGKSAPEDKSKETDPTPKGEDGASGEGDGKAPAADDAGEEGKTTPPAKTPKTYTKAELEAEKQKAIADAQKKWESEKDLSELERIKKENEDLKAANRLRDAKDAVVEAVTKAGGRSPELLWKTMQSDLEFDDSGKIKNLDTLVSGLKTDYPDQFGTPKPTDGIDGGAGNDKKGTTLTKEAIEKMTPAEINANWAEVSKVLASDK